MLSDRLPLSDTRNGRPVRGPVVERALSALILHSHPAR